VRLIVTLAIGYVVGSVPIAVLIARRNGVPDLRLTGDGNAGYWNAKNTLGRRAALPVFVGDAAKGAIAATVGLAIATDWWVAYLGAGAAMVGHAWPVFARFRGGRSVLTFAGAICVLAPFSAAVSIVVLLVVMVATRSFAWAARAGVFGLPFVQLFVDGRYRTAATGGLMTLIGLRFVQAALAARRSASTTQPEAVA
jgi:glycerol-3-phosphate acyltransferase PlsY